jgi:hypothetical protein
MKARFCLFLVLTLGLLVACQTAEPDSPTPTPMVEVAPTQPAPTQPPPTRPPATETAPAATPTESSASATPTATENDNMSLADSAVFAFDWDDREPFRTGLIEAEQPVLEQLPGASVYHLALQISPELNVVAAHQQVRYTNKEDVLLNEVYFHLFPNLLGGSTAVSNVKVNDETVSPQLESVNDSLLRIPLTTPLLPEEQITIEMDFTTTVPQQSGRNYGIFALLNDILALAHFYPQIAVYDEAGWDIEVPAESGDVVYADASFYLVQVRAPAAPTIVTSGVEIEREETAASQTLTFAAGPARDFYIAASERYTVVSETVAQTQINSYAPAELAGGAEAAITYARQALQSFNDRFGLYPYSELDIVSTPTQALGIEYPGVIALTSRIYDQGETTQDTPNRIYLESTTAHEVGHQWFYNVVGNDQLEQPWLDESVVQYATWLYYVDKYGESGARGFYQSLQNRWARVEGAEIPIGRPVEAYQGPEYSAIVYGRGPIFVRELSETMGEDTFAAFLRDYYETYHWDLVTTEEFKELAEQHCDCDLTPLFEEWVYEE